MDELRSALELATEDELKDLTEILFRRKFNPLDYLHAPDPVEVQSHDYHTWLDTLEQRFRFLAADGITVLKGQTQEVTYRQVLIRICRYLKLPYSTTLSTTDLEAEIFLGLLSRTWTRLPRSQRRVLTQRCQSALAQASLPQPLSFELQQDPMGLLLKGGSALAVSSVVRPVVLQQVARQFAIHVAAYQAAQQTAVYGVIGSLQGQAALQSARAGAALGAARYGAVRSLFTFLGPALWTWFVADLGWRAIATNYGRVIPTVFALAQIRLTRADEFSPAYP